MIGKLGISHGFGMIFGSFVGGMVTHYVSEEAATFFASGFILVCILLVCVFVPNDTKAIRRKLDGPSKDGKMILWLYSSKKYSLNAHLTYLIGQNFVG